MSDKCGNEGCLVDRLEEQFDKGINALQKNQSDNMSLIRESIETQLLMVVDTVKDMRSDNHSAHNEMFRRLRDVELKSQNQSSDAQVRLIISDVFDSNEDLQAVSRWRSSCRKWQVGVAIAITIPMAILVYKVTSHVLGVK